jgi:hydrogenase nickel incorporation protein HypA/HybF
MHELSIVMSIVEIAEKQAEKAHATTIETIELEIGELSGVEMNSFNFAWKQGIRNTLLGQSSLLISHPEGWGCCLECKREFKMQHIYDACPVCQSPFVSILKGKELKVKALTVSQKNNPITTS